MRARRRCRLSNAAATAKLRYDVHLHLAYAHSNVREGRLHAQNVRLALASGEASDARWVRSRSSGWSSKTGHRVAHAII